MRTGFRGALALGDARGLPYEGGRLAYETVRPLQSIGHHPRRISDDTRQTILVAEILLGRGWLDPVELSTRLRDGVSWGVGKGRATVRAIQQVAAGVPWHAAGSASPGNAAVMRAAPVGLCRWRDRSLRWTEAALVVTEPEQFDARRFADGLARTAAAWDPRRMSERRDPANRDHFWSGAFVQESLPAAVWCFLRHAQEPGEALRETLSAWATTRHRRQLGGHAGGGAPRRAGCPPHCSSHWRGATG